MIEASAGERAALALRFGVIAIDRLIATVTLSEHTRAILAEGNLEVDLTQACAVSGEDLPQHIAEPLAMRFVAAGGNPASEEIDLEIDSSEIDEIEYEGDSFDLGEAVAQTLALAIDPYAVGPQAEAARRDAGITGDDTPTGPLADALRALRGN